MIISMEPVLKRGYTAWDQDVLPADEFEERLAAVRRELKERGLEGLVIVNYSLLGAMFEYADIAYLGGLQSGGVLVVYADRDPTLLSFGGGRELAFMQEQTWIADVRAGRGQTFEAAAKLLAENGIMRGAAIGTVGTPSMPAAAVANLEKALGEYRLAESDDVLADLRAKKRPRELLAIGIARRIANDAATAGAQLFENGAENTAVMIEAERVARFGKARDVRVLVNMSPTELRPFEGRLDGRHEPLVLWVAAQYQGYWAESTAQIPAGGGAATDCLSAMSSTVKAGVSAGQVAAAGLAALPPDAVGPALQHGLGGTVGLSRQEGVIIEPDSSRTLEAGSVLSLSTFASMDGTASIANEMLIVEPGGSRVLEPVHLD